MLLPLTALLSEARVLSLGFALVIACAFLSLTVLTGTSGLISLAQAGLVGTGAFAYVHFMNGGVPFGFSLLLAGLVVVPLGVAIAVPALRLSGLFLALATFGVGQLIDGLLFGSWTWFSGGGDGLRGGRPPFLESDRWYVAFVVCVLALIVAAMGQLRRTGLGRTLVALRDSPTAADALGIDPLWPRVAIFSISAFLAGVAGGLYAGLLQAPSTPFFNTFTSLLWLTIAVVGGIQSGVRRRGGRAALLLRARSLLGWRRPLAVAHAALRRRCGAPGPAPRRAGRPGDRAVAQPARRVARP